MFIKLHAEPLEDGLLAQLNGDEWKLLTALALFINKDGKCYPTQDQLAELVGVSRATVNRRIGALCNRTYNGKSLLIKTQVRSNGGGFSNNVYTVNTEIFSIF